MSWRASDPAREEIAFRGSTILVEAKIHPTVVQRIAVPSPIDHVFKLRAVRRPSGLGVKISKAFYSG
jgi:hypothetical protein